MENSIIITVNLAGAVIGSVRSVDKQANTVYLAGGKDYSPGPHTRTILHTDRKPVVCNRSFTVAGDVVASWVTGTCPAWVKPSIWRGLSKGQRLAAQVQGFDEGFGVSFDSIGDGE